MVLFNVIKCLFHYEKIKEDSLELKMQRFHQSLQNEDSNESLFWIVQWKKAFYFHHKKKKITN